MVKEIAREKADRKEQQQQARQDFIARQYFSNFSQMIMKGVPHEKQAQAFRAATQMYLGISSDRRTEREILNTDVARLTGNRPIGPDAGNNVGVDRPGMKKRREIRSAGQEALGRTTAPGESSMDEIFGLMEKQPKKMSFINKEQFKALQQRLRQAERSLYDSMAGGMLVGTAGEETRKKLQDEVGYAQGRVEDFQNKFGGYTGATKSAAAEAIGVQPAAAKKKVAPSNYLNKLVRIHDPYPWQAGGFNTGDILQVQKLGKWAPIEDRDLPSVLRVAASELADPQEKQEVETVAASGNIEVMKQLLWEIVQDRGGK